eukprot:jgi/Psemu1/70072/estExt_Genemark1.C_13660006
MKMISETAQQPWEQHPYASLYTEIMLNSTDNSEAKETSPDVQLSCTSLNEDVMLSSTKPTKAKEISPKKFTHTSNTSIYSDPIMSKLPMVESRSMDCSIPNSNPLTTSQKKKPKHNSTAGDNPPKIVQSYIEMRIDHFGITKEEEEENQEDCLDTLPDFMRKGHLNSRSCDDSNDSMETIDFMETIDCYSMFYEEQVKAPSNFAPSNFDSPTLIPNYIATAKALPECATLLWDV